MHELLLGVPAVAAALGIAPSTIHRRIARGEMLPAAYAGKHALFTASDVDQLARGERPLTWEMRGDDGNR